MYPFLITLPVVVLLCNYFGEKYLAYNSLLPETLRTAHRTTARINAILFTLCLCCMLVLTYFTGVQMVFAIELLINGAKLLTNNHSGIKLYVAGGGGLIALGALITILVDWRRNDLRGVIDRWLRFSLFVFGTLCLAATLMALYAEAFIFNT